MSKSEEVYTYDIYENPDFYWWDPFSWSRYKVKTYREPDGTPYSFRKWETTLYAFTLKRAHKKAQQWYRRSKNPKSVGHGVLGDE